MPFSRPQCIHEFDSAKGVLFSEEEHGSGIIENAHAPNPDVAVFGDTLLYVNMDECTSCTACYQPNVCPTGVCVVHALVDDGLADAPRVQARPLMGLRLEQLDVVVEVHGAEVHRPDPHRRFALRATPTGAGERPAGMVERERWLGSMYI